MSISEMIKAHPDVGDSLNEPLALAVRHAMFCAAICNSCADADAAEDMDMRQCIRLCLDCSDICTATFKVAMRRTGSNEIVLQEMLQLCVTACDICAEECEKHDHQHCQRCAQMCRETSRDAKAAIETF